MTEELIDKKLIDCFWFLKNSCSKGKQCEFRHYPPVLNTTTICENWKQLKCLNYTCNFRHPSSSHLITKQTPCTFFMSGNCTRGNSCPYSHDSKRVNTTETKKVIEEKNVKEATPPITESQSTKSSQIEVLNQLSIPRIVFQGGKSSSPSPSPSSSSLNQKSQSVSGVSKKQEATSISSNSEIQSQAPKTKGKTTDPSKSWLSIDTTAAHKTRFGVKPLSELVTTGDHSSSDHNPVSSSENSNHTCQNETDSKKEVDNGTNHKTQTLINSSEKKRKLETEEEDSHLAIKRLKQSPTSVIDSIVEDEDSIIEDEIDI